MIAVVFDRHGGPDVMEFREVPDPEPGPGQVRVRVAGCGVNHLDLWVREGMPGVAPLPHIAGSEVSGTIDRLGPGVSRLREGQGVIVLPGRQVGDDLAQPIRSLCGVPAVDAVGVIMPGEVGRLGAAWAAQGRRLVVVAERDTQLTLAGATAFARFDLSGHREIERTLDRRPAKLTVNRQAVVLGRPG